MALSFPLAPEAFFASLPIQSALLSLTVASQVSGRTAGGAVLTSGLGSRLWTGRVTLVPMRWADAEAVRARLSILCEPGRSLLVHPFPLRAPRSDPDGAILGSATPAIHTLAGNNREMRISGLRAGYRLSAGDGIAFAYGSNPTRYAYHRVVSDSVIASSAGLTPLFEVTPHIRPGASTGTAVRLVNPFFKAVIDPATVVDGADSGRFITGISFDVVQTLR